MGPAQQLLCVSLVLSLGDFCKLEFAVLSAAFHPPAAVLGSAYPQPGTKSLIPALRPCCQGGWLSSALPCKCPKYWLERFPVGSSPCQEGRWEAERHQQEISLGGKAFPLGVLCPDPWQLPLAPGFRNWGEKGQRNKRYSVESRIKLALDGPAQEDEEDGNTSLLS